MSPLGLVRCGASDSWVGTSSGICNHHLERAYRDLLAHDQARHDLIVGTLVFALEQDLDLA